MKKYEFNGNEKQIKEQNTETKETELTLSNIHKHGINGAIKIYLIIPEAAYFFIKQTPPLFFSMLL